MPVVILMAHLHASLISRLANAFYKGKNNSMVYLHVSPISHYASSCFKKAKKKPFSHVGA